MLPALLLRVRRYLSMCVGCRREGGRGTTARQGTLSFSLSLSVFILPSLLGSTSQLVLRLCALITFACIPSSHFSHFCFAISFAPVSLVRVLSVCVCQCALVCVYSRRLCTQFRYTLIPPINFDNFIISLFIHFFLFSLLLFSVRQTMQ